MNRNKDDDQFAKRWEGWSNKERLAWMINLRDQLKAKYAKVLDVTDEEIEEIERDIALMEQVVEQEKQAKLRQKLFEEEQKMNFTADEILRGMDKANKKSIYIPPKLPKDKKSN